MTSLLLPLQQTCSTFVLLLVFLVFLKQDNIILLKLTQSRKHPSIESQDCKRTKHTISPFVQYQQIPPAHWMILRLFEHYWHATQRRLKDVNLPDNLFIVFNRRPTRATIFRRTGTIPIRSNSNAKSPHSPPAALSLPHQTQLLHRQHASQNRRSSVLMTRDAYSRAR